LRRIIIGFGVVTLLHLAEPAMAEPAPPGTAAPALTQLGVPPSEAELRDRATRLEASLKASQEEIKRLGDEHVKLRERLDGVKEKQDGFWTPFGPGLGVIIGVLAFVAGVLFTVFGLVLPRIRKSLVEDGLPGLVKSAVAALQEGSGLPRLLEAHREEITRVVLAKDVCIRIEGDEEESTLLHELLLKRGYAKCRYGVNAGNDTEAEVVVLVGLDTCNTRGRELLPKLEHDQKPVLLYTGPRRMEDTLLSELNKATLAIPANTLGTALAHLGALAAMTRRVSETKRGSV
jgi:hypothetical protein